MLAEEPSAQPIDQGIERGLATVPATAIADVGYSESAQPAGLVFSEPGESGASLEGNSASQADKHTGNTKQGTNLALQARPKPTASSCKTVRSRIDSMFSLYMLQHILSQQLSACDRCTASCTTDDHLMSFCLLLAPLVCVCRFTSTHAALEHVIRGCTSLCAATHIRTSCVHAQDELGLPQIPPEALQVQALLSLDSQKRNNICQLGSNKMLTSAGTSVMLFDLTTRLAEYLDVPVQGGIGALAATADGRYGLATAVTLQSLIVSIHDQTPSLVATIKPPADQRVCQTGDICCECQHAHTPPQLVSTMLRVLTLTASDCFMLECLRKPNVLIAPQHTAKHLSVFLACHDLSSMYEDLQGLHVFGSPRILGAQPRGHCSAVFAFALLCMDCALFDLQVFSRGREEVVRRSKGLHIPVS